MGAFDSHITLHILPAYVILNLLKRTKSINIQTYYLFYKWDMKFMCIVTWDEQ
jgi:hypothetical protein